MEVAGVVASVGPEVSTLKVGQRVAAITSLGGYAEKVAMDERGVFAIDQMDGADACALLVAYGTSHHALK